MNTEQSIKEQVREKYGEIAKGKFSLEITPSSCCGTPLSSSTDCGCSTVDMSSEYTGPEAAAIPDGANLGLGCGTPASFAGITEGQTILDLGSGAGVDCFIAAAMVGPNGKVIGVDMTEAMIAKARENARKVEASNVEFRLGEIEHMPVDSGTVDRVISNCVINLVPDKNAAFAEIHRVLKQGGTFTISDIVADGEITPEERRDASLWAGCISGAISRGEYLGIISALGFLDVVIVSERRYDYQLRNGGGLFSITVTGTK